MAAWSVLVGILLFPSSMLSQSPPSIKAEYVSGPGVINDVSIEYSFCMEATIEFTIVPEENTPFFLRIHLNHYFDLVSWDLPQDVTVIDPVWEDQWGGRDIEVAFPGMQGEFEEPTGRLRLKLKHASYAAVGGKEFKLMAHYDDKDEFGFPNNWNHVGLHYKFNKTFFVEGVDLSLDELVIEGDMPTGAGANAPYIIGIDGSLIVDTDWSITNPEDVIFMFEGSKIAIESASAVLRATTIKGCNSWWDAIEVKGAGFLGLEQSFGNDRARVKDAVHGVRLLNGASAIINGVDFVDNMIGIYSPPSSTGGLKYVNLWVDNSHFRENAFQAPPLQSPYQLDHPYAAIQLYDVFNWVNLCTFGPNCSNLIDGMYHGIILSNFENVELQGFRIQNLHNDSHDNIPYANHGIVATSDYLDATFKYTGYGKTGDYLFKNLGTAIRLEKVKSEVVNTRMEDVGIGIWHVGNVLKDLKVHDNRFYVRNYGIVSLFNAGGSIDIAGNDIRHYQYLGGGGISANTGYGIALINNTAMPGQIKIEDNIIDMPKAIAGIYNLHSDGSIIAENTIYGGDRLGEYGIQVSGGSMHLIDCNLASRSEGSVSDPSAGIYVQMLEGSSLRCNALYDYPRGIEYFGMSLGSLMEANELSDHKIGLLYDHEAETGVHNWSGNRWTNEYDTQNDEIGARNTSDDEDKVDKSKYYVDITPHSTHGEFGTSVESQHDWFIIWEEPYPTIQCGDTEFKTCIDGPGANHEYFVRPPDSLAWRIAVDSFTSVIYGGGAVWTAQRQLYRRLMRSPEFVTAQSEWENFMDTHETGSVGIYEYIRAGWYAAHQPDSARMILMEELFEVKDSLYAELIELYDVIAEASTQSEIDSLLALLEGPHTVLAAVSEALVQHYDTLHYERTQALQALESINDQAPDADDWELAQGQVNAIMIQAALDGHESLDSMQRVRLQDIADECPMEMGEAVFQARGMLMLWDPSLYWADDTRCSMAQPRSAEASVQSGQLSVFPNPVRTAMYVHLTGEVEGIWTLQLLNPMGQQVAMWERPVGLHGIELPVLPAGIYTLRADHAKGSRMHTRVVIAR